MLESDIVDGSLDVYFTKPLPVLYSIICNDLRIVEIFAQLLPSVIVLILSCVYNQIQWNFWKVLVLVGAIIGGAIIQMVLFLLIGSVSFWTVRSGSFASIFYSFKDFLNYPLYVYGKEVLMFLTYILPMAFINYYPALYILEREDSGNILNFMTLPVSFLLAGIAAIVWKKALNHYSSTGS